MGSWERARTLVVVLVGPGIATSVGPKRAVHCLRGACLGYNLLRPLAEFRQVLQVMSQFLVTATLSSSCWTLFLAVVVSRVVVSVVPALLLSSSLQLHWQLGWWLVVLFVAGVCCLPLRLYAAACHCCWLSPAAAVAAAGRGLVCLPGAVDAAGLL